MNNKEFKSYWGSKTLGELRGYIEERERVLQNMKDIALEEAVKITKLDMEYKWYSRDLYDLADKVKRYGKDIKDTEKDLSLLYPILEKKELEGIDQSEYEKYIKDNADIRILIQKVNEDKEQFIKDGSKAYAYYKKEKIEITLSEEETNDLFDTLLKETIILLKDNIGNIEKINYFRSNDNKGYDGQFIGNKGAVNINTILAGGYNIQKLHYRTLVYKYR